MNLSQQLWDLENLSQDLVYSSLINPICLGIGSVSKHFVVCEHLSFIVWQCIYLLVWVVQEIFPVIEVGPKVKYVIVYDK